MLNMYLSINFKEKAFLVLKDFVIFVEDFHFVNFYDASRRIHHVKEYPKSYVCKFIIT